MKLLLELSGEHEKLPMAELESVLMGEKIGYKIVEHIPEKRLILLEVKTKNFNFLQRLALTRKAAEFVAKGTDTKKIANEVYKKIKKTRSFAVRCVSHTVEEKLGEQIYKLGLKVNLKNPEIVVLCFSYQDKIYAGISIPLERNFDERKPKFRPYFSPAAMNPKTARMLVNLAQVMKGDSVLDPFCGTGGILIEAGLMGMKLQGIEYDWHAVHGCEDNLKFYKLKGKISQGDALKTKLKKKADAIVSDLPYGRSTIVTEKNIKQLYTKFLPVASENLKPRKIFVMVIPADCRIGFKKYFSLLGEYTIYVHKSLSRKILVLRKRD